MKKNKIYNLTAAFCIMFAVLFCFPAAVSAKTKQLDDYEFTQKNVMNILKSVDSDGAYLVQYGINSGSDITVWESSWGMLYGLGTAVHEECHGYSFYHYYGSGHVSAGQDIYIGNQKYISVQQTSVFKSEVMAAKIPSKLRTFRYSTYVAKNVSTSSNVDGIYGLLNEFTAYYWGAHSENLISAKYGVWDNEANLAEPYYEFLYWMTNYMIYAKEYYPAVYQGILNNEDFKEAFVLIEEKYRNEITAYLDKGFTLGSESTMLKNVLSKNKYQKMLQKMGVSSTEAGTNAGSSTQTASVKVGTTFSSGNNKYKVTGKKTVSFVGLKNEKATTAKIGKTVKYKGNTYTVTEISAKAFYGNSSVKKITIGVGIKKIGASAFQGAKNLKEIQINSKVLETVGSNALKGIYSKARIKVPSAKLSAYKKLLNKKGQAKTVKIIKK